MTHLSFILAAPESLIFVITEQVVERLPFRNYFSMVVRVTGLAQEVLRQVRRQHVTQVLLRCVFVVTIASTFVSYSSLCKFFGADYIVLFTGAIFIDLLVIHFSMLYGFSAEFTRLFE